MEGSTAVGSSLAVWPRFIRVLVACLLVPGTLAAQVWLPPSGPEGGGASCLVSSDHSLLAGGFGLLRTDDASHAWQALPTDLSFAAITVFQGSLFALAAAPAPFAPFKLMTSADGGQSWIDVPGVDGSYQLFSSGGSLYVADDRGIESSTDGVQWTPVPDLLLGPAQGFASVGGSVFVGSGARIQKTSDGGHTWFLGALPTPDNGFLTALGSFGGVLLAGIGRFSGSPSPPTIARSADGGDSWSTFPVGYWVSAFGQAGPSLLAGLQDGNILRSDDAGFTWADSSTGLSGQFPVVAFETLGSSVFAATGFGVFESDDSGRSWTARRTGFDRSDVILLAAAGNVLFAQTRDGLRRSPDAGASWLDTGFTAGHLFTSDESLIYGVVVANSKYAQLGRSTDHGATWDLADLPFVVNDLAVWKGLLFAASADGVFSSVDGRQWASANGNLPRSPVYSLRGTATALLAALSDGRLYRSVDGGAHWSKSVVADSQAGTSSIPPQDARDAVYSTGPDGLFRSLDGGATWRRIGDAAPGFIRHLATFGGRVFVSCQFVTENPAGVYNMGVFLLQSDGSWVEVNRGLLSFNVTGLAVAGGSLFAGVEGGSVQKFQPDRSMVSIEPAFPVVPVPIARSRRGRGLEER